MIHNFLWYEIEVKNVIKMCCDLNEELQVF